MEDKKKICNDLLPVIRQTRAGQFVTELYYVKYDSNEERVLITEKMKNGNELVTEVNVTADSGAAMLMDIIKMLM